jgi:hypothetical protein
MRKRVLCRNGKFKIILSTTTIRQTKTAASVLTATCSQPCVSSTCPRSVAAVTPLSSKVCRGSQLMNQGPNTNNFFLAPLYEATFSFSNIRRCPGCSTPAMNPLNCGSFQIRHGYEPHIQACAACTQAIQSCPPDQLKPSPLAVPDELGRYDDGPPRARTQPTYFPDEDLGGRPGMSTAFQPRSHEEEYRASLWLWDNEFPPGVPFPLNTPIPPWRGSGDGPAAAMRRHPTRTPPIPSNHLYRLSQHVSTSAGPPRSNSQHRNENRVAELTKLLDEQLNRGQELASKNEELRRENEDLKTENANLKSW